MPVVLHLGNNRHAKPTGFTLVEMVVVIFISSLLAALMFPALSSAKEKSIRCVCRNNIGQLMLCVNEYADDNDNSLPSSADNAGNYHSIILSDLTFSNLYAYSSSDSNIFYCPNIVFNAASPVAQHNKNGCVIGYSYWAGAVLASQKGSDSIILPSKITDSSATTNALITDANFWTPNQTASAYFPAAMTVSPHDSLGGASSQGSSFTTGVPGGTNSAGLGSQGGNAGFLPRTVVWRPINSMQTLPASSINDASGNR
jgi:prepilin-type N-terminal cleavage/methylation domain-containing protein